MYPSSPFHLCKHKEEHISDVQDEETLNFSPGVGPFQRWLEQMDFWRGGHTEGEEEKEIEKALATRRQRGTYNTLLHRLLYLPANITNLHFHLFVSPGFLHPSVFLLCSVLGGIPEDSV